MIIIDFNKENIEYLLNNIIPYKKEKIIFYIHHYTIIKDENDLIEIVSKLYNLNYINYIINNLAHINILKKIKKLNLIAGKYLYTFNNFGIKFLYENKINYFISPLENNKINLYSSVIDKNSHSIIVFDFPLLFKIRAKLDNKKQWFLSNQ